MDLINITSKMIGNVIKCKLSKSVVTYYNVWLFNPLDIPDFVWSLSNDIILSVSYDGTARLWNVASGACIRTFKDITGAELHCCIFHPLNNNMFVVSFTGESFLTLSHTCNTGRHVYECKNRKADVYLIVQKLKCVAAVLHRSE